MRLLIATLIAFAGVSAAHADGFSTGNKLLDDCQNDNHFFVADCNGYIAAIFDTMTNNPINGSSMCAPSDVSRKQVEDIAVQWLQSHPQIRHYGAAGLVAAALAEAFPC